jgi:glycosyltransferase involved in cell wall biosynthesis
VTVMARSLDRILIVSPRFPPAIGGLERLVQELAERLVRRGLAVDVATTDPTGTLPAVEESCGITIRRFHTVANDSVFFVSPALTRWLWREVGNYDVIHAHSYHTPLAFAATAAGRRHGIPVVLTPVYHGTGHSPMRSLLHRPYRPFGARVVRGVRAVICLSEAERSLVTRDFGDSRRTVVIPPGVDLERIRNASRPPESRGPIVLSVGRLESYKRVDSLVAAIAFLPPNHRIVVVGDGPERVRLETLARERGVAERVEFTGFIADAALDGWLRAADVIVSLSTAESFGLTLLEGAAGGARVVASDIAAHREVAGYLPAGAVSLVQVAATPQKVAEEIVSAVARRLDPAEVASAVPSWDRMADRVLRVYRRCTSRGGPQETSTVSKHDGKDSQLERS